MTVSRDQFDETKNWTEPEWQEGVPVMDADLNLAMKIGKTGLRRAVCDFLGNGSSNDGFKLSGLVTDPTIHTGNLWVAGLKIELPEDVPASGQPNAPVTFPSGDGIWYLDIVEVLLTNADDPAIRDPRLPANVETPVKVWKTDWTLRKVPGSSLPVPAPDHYHMGITLEAGGVFTDIRNTGMIFAGADTGYQDRIGGRPGSGHRHRDEDIDVENPNFSCDKLDEVLDEIGSRIENVESGGGVVGPHAASHAGGGSDPVNIANLPGQCTQSQISPAHPGLHTASFNGGLPISPDVNGNTSLGAHLSDTDIHGGGGVTDHGALSGLADDDHPQYLNSPRHSTTGHAGLPGVVSDHGALSGLSDDDHQQYLNSTRHSGLNHSGLPGVVNDHGGLSGLGDDDHAQYLNNSRHDSRHSAAFNNALAISGAVGGDATLGAHVGNSGRHVTDHGSLGGLGDDDHPQYLKTGDHTSDIHRGLGILPLSIYRAEARGFVLASFTPDELVMGAGAFTWDSPGVQSNSFLEIVVDVGFQFRPYPSSKGITGCEYAWGPTMIQVSHHTAFDTQMPVLSFSAFPCGAGGESASVNEDVHCIKVKIYNPHNSLVHPGGVYRIAFGWMIVAPRPGL